MLHNGRYRMSSPSGTDREQALGLSLMVHNRMCKPLVSGAIHFIFCYLSFLIAGNVGYHH